ncbi:hypothetical protein G3492_08820 [Shewanella baltica]|nr:hypothetical protein [Shewanella baltica]UVW65461.1 hypothetical protein HHE93_18560 [Shewanella baltica]
MLESVHNYWNVSMRQRLALMNNQIITYGLALFLLYAGSTDARFIRQDLAQAVLSTENIVDVTVISSEMIEWTHTPKWKVSLGDKSLCGYKNKVRVNESLSKPNSDQLTLGSKEELIPGRRYLLFIEERGGFANDVIYKHEGDERTRFEDCLSRVPKLKSNWLTTSYFSGDSESKVTLSYWLIPPNDLPHNTFYISEVRQNGKLVPLTESAVDVKIKDELVLPRDIVLWKDLRSWMIDLTNPSTK